VKRNVAVAVAAVVLAVGAGLGAVAITRAASAAPALRLRYWHGGQRDYVYRWAVLPGATIPGWNGGPQA
jgi:hypothetical protein